MVTLPVVIIFIPIITSLIIYLIKDPRSYYLALIAQAAITVLAFYYFWHFRDDYSLTLLRIGGWEQTIGISIRNDEISMVFVFLAIFAWWMVLLYVFDTKKLDYNFLFFLLFLQGVFLGLLQTNDLFNAFVFVELTTIIVTILIAFKKVGNAFRSGLYYLLLNTSGVLLFLIGIIFIYYTFGTINMLHVSEHMHLHANSTLIRFAYLLMLAGVAVKSALFPVFTWLPKAHGAAQSVVSALLSGLIVKGGLYLFIRINWMFSGAEIPYSMFFFVIGALTAYLGIMFAITQTDIKQMLAYSTVSQVGIIMMGLSSLDEQLFYGGILHIINHALFKMLLFMIAGLIVKVYLSKNVNNIRGMFRTMPFVSTTMIIAMLAITGLPFLNGYLSKSFILYGYQDSTWQYWLVFIVNIGTATLFVKFSTMLFGPKRLSYPVKHIRQDSVLGLIALAIIVFGNIFLFTDWLNFFDLDFTLLKPGSFTAFLDYFVIAGLGFLFYWFVVRQDGRFIRTLRKFNLSFEHANYIFIVFAAFMAIYFVFIT